MWLTRRRLLGGAVGAAATGLAMGQATGAPLTESAVSGRTTRQSEPADADHAGDRPTVEGAAVTYEAVRVTVYSRNQVDQASAVVPLPTGGAVLVGSTVASTGRDAWFVNVAPDGNKRWDLTTGGRFPEPVFDATLDLSGDLIAVGASLEEDDAQALLLRIDDAGGLVLRRTYTPSPENARAVAPLGNGNHMLAGVTIRPRTEEPTGVLREVRPGGETVERRTLQTDGGSGLTAASPTPDGGVVCAGWHRRPGTEVRRLLVGRWTSNRRRRWLNRTPLPVATVGDVIVAPDGDVVVGGAIPADVPKGLVARFGAEGASTRTYVDSRKPDSLVNALTVANDGVIFGGLRDGPRSSAWVGRLQGARPAAEARVGPRWLTAVNGMATQGSRPIIVGTTRFTGDGQKAYLATLRPQQRQPEAKFVVEPPSPTVEQPVRFTATPSSDPNGTIAAYAWDFDGTGRIDASGEVVTYAFATPGQYRVRLQVTDDDGASAVASRVVRVSGRSPTEGETATEVDGLGVGAAAVGLAGAAAARLRWS